MARLSQLEAGGNLRQVFTLRTAVAAGEGTLPSVAGRYETEDDALRFVPAFPLLGGEEYVARWSGVDEGPSMEIAFVVPAVPAVAAGRVVSIYPTASDLPANLLRVYVQFDRAMSRGRAVDFIHLYDRSGAELEGAFVVPERELWSGEGDRLTLFFDPGRLKQGVGANLDVGAPLEAGGAYRLVVDAAWPDAGGNPLTQSFEKHFRIGAADRLQPDADLWVLRPPVDDAAALEVEFPESLDRGLLARMLTVVDGRDEAIEGEIVIDREERRWRWRPNAGWVPGAYTLRVDVDLEDVAGNSLRRLFDAPLTSQPGGSERALGEFVDLDFEVDAN